jgi:hypothetical protein
VGIGIQLVPLGTAATDWPILPAPGDYDDGEFGGLKIGKGNRITRRKPAPAPLCPPKIPLDQTWDRTRAATVGSQRLTVWAMVRPQLLSYRISTSVKYHFLLNTVKLWTHDDCMLRVPLFLVTRIAHLQNQHFVSFVEGRATTNGWKRSFKCVGGMKCIITFISFEYVLIELKNILGKMGRSSVYLSSQCGCVI